MAATGLRTNHQSRVDWWRRQFQRQRKMNLSVTDFCRQLGVSVTTFYYWKKRVHESLPNAPGRVSGVRSGEPGSLFRGERPSHRMTSTTGTASANFVPVSILEPAAGTELEIELTNDCVVRLKGVIDPPLLQAAITAAGQLDGSREGAN
jgi:transposase-like protein